VRGSSNGKDRIIAQTLHLKDVGGIKGAGCSHGGQETDKIMWEKSGGKNFGIMGSELTVAKAFG
jgi:hypothetical protein